MPAVWHINSMRLAKRLVPATAIRQETAHGLSGPPLQVRDVEPAIGAAPGVEALTAHTA